MPVSATLYIDEFRHAVWGCGDALTSTQRLVLLAMSQRADWNTGGSCYPGADLLAKLTGLNRRTIVRTRQQLEERCGEPGSGWLQVEERAGARRATRYRLVVPTGVVVSPEVIHTGDPESPLTGDRVSSLVKRTGDMVSKTGDTVSATGDLVSPNHHYHQRSTTAVDPAPTCTRCDCPTDRPGTYVHDSLDIICDHRPPSEEAYLA